MSNESFLYKGANGKDIFCRRWNTEDKPAGIVQIIHGMAEHAGRYDDFARYLNTLGFAVYAGDLSGHGRTGEMNHNLRDLDDDGFNGIMHDQNILTKLVRDKHPGIPVFILAHSFGSFIAQEYIKHFGGEIDGLILSGSCKMEGPAIPAGMVIAAVSRLFGKSRPNELLNRLGFGSFNKGIPNPSSKFEWISRDGEQVKKYEEDKYCGFTMSSNFYYYFSKGLLRLYKNTGSIPGNLPVCLISGDRDPVGLYGAGVEKLFEMYKALGISDLQLKLYPGCRHEILNELNRREVYGDISAWLQKHCAS